MYIKVKFVEGFKDGTIFPDRSFSPNEEAVVTQLQLEQIQRSGGTVQVVENVMRNPLKDEKKLRREDMADPQNAENSINRLENHVPGTEDEQEEVRLRELQRRADKGVEKVGAESVFNEEPARVDAEAMAKVEEARLERKRAHEADLEKGRQEEAERLEAVAREEEREAADARKDAEEKKQNKKRK